MEGIVIRIPSLFNRPTPVDLATPTFGDAETIFKYVGAESEKDDDDDDNDDNESSNQERVI